MSKLELSRRDFLRLAGITASAVAVDQGVALARYLVYEQVMRDRQEMPKSSLSDTFFLGVTPDAGWLEHPELMTEQIGFSPHVINHFLYGFGYGKNPDEEPVWNDISRIQQGGWISMISWGEWMPLWSISETKNQTTLFQRLAKLPGKKVFRPWYEMNGEWTKQWYGHTSPEMYTTVWRSMYEQLRAVDTDHSIDVCWCPNARTGLGIDRIETYFPGDGYVDVIGIDVYNKHSHNPFDIGRHVFTPDLIPMEAIGPEIAVIQRLSNKPWFVAEVNIQRESGKREWICGLIDVVRNTGGIGFMPFLLDKSDVEHNWNDREVIEAVQSFPQLLRR